MGAEAANKFTIIDFEETELRLGLPLSTGTANGDNEAAAAAATKNAAVNMYGKRGFSETTVDLKLNLNCCDDKTSSEKMMTENKPADPAKPPASKAQVVGWPPVRSFRKNAMGVQSKSRAEEEAVAAFVKVSLDGAPYLRKVDLKSYKSYQQLSDALTTMFSSFTIAGNCGSDRINESKLMDLLNGSDYVPTYEDKDGDWMLLGDVPWEMFVESCKRLRIMKGSEAIGLAPRAVEKCKNRR